MSDSKIAPVPINRCPKCGAAPFRPFLRGQFKSIWRTIRRRACWALICSNCEQIVGYEETRFQPPQRPTFSDVHVRVRVEENIVPYAVGPRTPAMECVECASDPLPPSTLHMMHCARCLRERPPHVSPRDWSRQSFGVFSKRDHPGVFLQLWCNRHDCAITTIEVVTPDWRFSNETCVSGRQGEVQ
jgi:hypothetical protein